MKIIELDQNSEEWFHYRLGKSGGSNFGKLFKTSGRGNDKVRDYAYTLLAERVARPMTPNDYLDDMPEEMKGMPFSWAIRGHILEPRVADLFSKKYNLVLSEGKVWEDEDAKESYVSPDRSIVGQDGKIKEAVEIKCLSTDKVLKVWADSMSKSAFEAIPNNDYQAQVLKYFMINKDLEKLYWVVYTDLIIDHPDFMVVLEIKREDVISMVEDAKKVEIATLLYVDNLENKLKSIDNTISL